ncbi:MAG: site-2 protease family protein [Candidatus Zipacnadales bacterium]
MGGSVQIGRVFGIPVRVHITFLLLLVFIAVAGLLRGGLSQAAWSVLFIAALFACVVLHELAHSLVARAYGVKVEGIMLLPIGGVAGMEEMPRKPTEEAFMAIAGPAVSLSLAALLWTIINLTGYRGPLAYYDEPLLLMLMWTNIIIAAFNLLPAFPMDGGRVLRAVLAHYIGLLEATRIAVSIGQIMAVVIALAGIFLFKMNLWLVLIAMFIFFGAGQEGRQVQMQAFLRGVAARQAMVTRFETLPRTAPLSVALAYASQGYQHDFPVVQGDMIVGVVTRQDLLNGLYSLGPEHHVGEVMTTQVCQVAPHATLEEVYRGMSQGNCRIVLVREADRIVGLITPDSIGDQLAAAATGHLWGSGREE